MNDVVNKLFERHSMYVNRLDYVPPKPFFYGVDWDGLLPCEREILAEAGCCPKCSDNNWKVVRTTKKADGVDTDTLKCGTCEYFVASTNEVKLACDFKQFTVNTVRDGSSPKLSMVLGAPRATGSSTLSETKQDFLKTVSKQAKPYKALTRVQKMRRVEAWWDSLDFETKQEYYNEWVADERFARVFKSKRFKFDTL
jgi:hypothetical protein